ncbi:hypothetical protein, partial [Nocardia sp. NPDC019395]|uniref:hypothetical protein n=1 Tax=Nocardia sp. NPDC019395 TaxID=3154686 RepID=UPI0033C420D7
ERAYEAHRRTATTADVRMNHVDVSRETSGLPALEGCRTRDCATKSDEFRVSRARRSDSAFFSGPLLAS